MTTEEKCFALTGAFEGGGYGNLAGNFDGQGISFGFLCWNLGRGTLQPLLRAMAAEGPKTFKRCLTQHVTLYGGPTDLSADLLAVCAMRPSAAVAWAAARQDADHRLLPHWTAAFRALATEPGFRAIQRRHAEPYMARARGYVRAYGWKSERALALCFDIAVQMGSIGPGAAARYRVATVGRGLAEPAQLVAMARAIAPQGGRWAADVLSRKLTIAAGSGIVHGRSYQLERDFDITLRAVVR